MNMKDFLVPLLVTIIGGVIVAFIIQDARFKSPEPTSSPTLVTQVEQSLQATTTDAPEAATATPEPTPTPAPPTATMTLTLVPTPTREPITVLYEADWSTGLNGWAGSSDWKVVDGMLVNDGSQDNLGPRSEIIAPYRIEVDNYIVEAEVSGPDSGYISSEKGFGLLARGSNEGGYWGSVSPYDIRIETRGPWPARFAEKSYGPGDGFHTYRLEVAGGNISFFIDGALFLEATDFKYLSGNQVGLWDKHIKLSVRSFRILSREEGTP